MCFYFVSPWLFLCVSSIILKLKENTDPNIPGTKQTKMFLFNPLVRRLDEAKICGLYLSQRLNISSTSIFRLIYRISPEKKNTKFMHGVYESKFIVTGIIPQYRVKK